MAGSREDHKRMRGKQSYVDCVRTIDFEPYCHDVPSVFYQEVDASYQRGGIAIRAGINNLSDRDPPYLGAGEANANTPTYRLLGRTYFLQVSYAIT